MWLQAALEATHTPGPQHLSERSVYRDSEHALPTAQIPRMRWLPTAIPLLLVAGHLRQLPHTPALAADVIDVDAEKKAVAVVFHAPVYNPLTGDM